MQASLCSIMVLFQTSSAPLPRWNLAGRRKMFPRLTEINHMYISHVTFICSSKNSSRYQWHRKVYFKMPLHSMFLSWKSVSTKMSTNAFGKGIHGFDLSARRCALGSVRRTCDLMSWWSFETIKLPVHPFCLRILSKRSR